MEQKDPSRYGAFKEKTTVFLKKNGFTVVLCLCLCVIGIATAAAFLPAEPKPEAPAPTPAPTAAAASQSGDERLNQALSPTPAPTPAAKPSAAPAPVKKEPAPQKAAPPLEGEILWGYAVDQLIYSETLEQWTTHPGVDIAAREGSEVKCVCNGEVEQVYTDNAFGVTVVVAHSGNRKSLYANLQQDPPVKVGQKVEAADVIGLVGDTATSECMQKSHLHFGFFHDGAFCDPKDYVLLGK